MPNLGELVSKGERENIEFKEYLTDYHLKEGRRQSLACQMNHRILMGKGVAYYIIGISDSGEFKGIKKEELDKTIEVLEVIAKDIDAKVTEKEVYEVNGGYIAVVEIRKDKPKEHITVGTAGHVDHGKSTLVGCLITGKCDDGDGLTRIYLDTLKHEIERGLSADLSFAVLGFKNGKAIRMKNPLSKAEKAWVVENSEKIVSFVDTVGHEPWLRTAIRGLIGQRIDYGLLTIAADDGIMRITKEHLGILLAMELPVIIAITKADKVSDERIKSLISEISKLLRGLGRVPYLLKSRSDAEKVSRLMAKNSFVVPIVVTSAITLAGYDILEELLYRLPKLRYEESDFLMYIDRIYKVTGVGTVVSGTIKSGEISEGDEVFVGPFSDGSFVKTKVSSIEMHHYRVERAKSGDIVGLALKNISVEDLRRGMVVTKTEPYAVREFEAEVYVFTHPTKISSGYEPVLHCETISETVIFKEIDKEFLKAGDRGRVRIRFKYNPQYIMPGQRFIFREGRSKGMGEVVKIYETES